jgi:hypothetical protein
MENKTFNDLDELKKYYYENFNKIKNLALMYSSQKDIDDDDAFFNMWCFNEYKRITIGLKKYEKNYMEYAKFTPLPKTDEEIIEEHTTHTTRQDNIQKIVDDKNLIKLKCDYFGMDSYYYNKNNKTMYKVCNINTMFDKSTIPKFEVSYDSHILEINNITE